MKNMILIPAFTLALSSGYLSGRMLAAPELTLTLQEDTRPLVPTIQIDGVRNGILHGKTIGSARVVLGKTVLTSSGIFALDAQSILHNAVEVVVPDGMQFVASSKGKKYYPVFSSSGNRITPKNRLYFRTAKEAEIAGYRA
ncbi:hypothetical protein HOL63_01480 [Candidatus Peregrinibacteria bacterium]|jgi:hypothetical protein|nr:hypothetical protein [Candidatus Peregrinibacteria bacterium]MBT5468255.1 hypothetical protein [Candidatus Peregrinibacteria bacterium]MBT7337667.1 hypothetical protein [Candidatus Peregrinibacteria bacterium]